MNFPYFLTQEGRKTVRDAREAKKPLEEKRRLTPSQQRELQRLQGITRRDLLEKILLGGLASMGIGYGIMKINEDHSDDPEKIEGNERFVALANAINRSELGSASWSHPRGADDDYPSRPIVFVEYPHPEPGTPVNDEYMHCLHNTLLLVLLCRKCNLKTFNFEGAPNEPFPKDQIPVKNNEDRTLTPKEQRIFLRNFDNFRQEMSDQPFPQIQAVLAACMDPDIDCRGLENPQEAEKTFKYLHETYQPTLVEASRLFDYCEQHGKPSFEKDANGKITKGKFGNQEEFDPKPMAELLHRFLEVVLSDIIVGNREKYITDALRNREVLLCGPMHARNLRSMFLSQGQSFLTVHPKGSPFTAEDIRDTKDFKLAQEILQEIEGK